MPFNYHYSLASVIYGIMKKPEPNLASFFHDLGHGREHFKFFTFSDIDVPFLAKGDRMLLLAEQARLMICFHVPTASEHFLKVLFANQLLIIGDQKSVAKFSVQSVTSFFPALQGSPEDILSAVVQPVSPIVVCYWPSQCTNWQYLSPHEKPFTERLIFNWLQKYKVLTSASYSEIESLRAKIKIEVLFFQNPPAARTITIKDGLPDAHKIRGYTKFRLRLTAPKKMIDLALNSGLGSKNSMGMGCIKLIN